MHDGSGGVPGGTGKDAVSAQGLMLIEEGLRRAMSEIEDLRSMLSDVSKLKRSVAHAEALRDEVDSSMAALRDGLRSVQEAMSRKADRSEMDAMLDAGVAFGPGNMAGAAGAVQRQLDEAADSKDIVGMLNDLANKVTAISTAQKVNVPMTIGCIQEKLGLSPWQHRLI